ncbi:hypothetical protein D8674_019293 [Pyrus ussuriensis x Pyrus communis]|uniref:Uncharacterized protein n=1 Tax=Pyrus ussuriensis x Pyrus communis TaxID=2448454 RepID=A0A5N5GBX4_9ROSA|nr:hypothetical protein D8674_019293 [Pyrus ussuriensis x Pyrus communis]
MSSVEFVCRVLELSPAQVFSTPLRGFSEGDDQRRLENRPGWRFLELTVEKAVDASRICNDWKHGTEEILGPA